MGLMKNVLIMKMFEHFLDVLVNSFKPIPSLLSTNSKDQLQFITSHL